jgi:hypothetical protein
MLRYRRVLLMACTGSLLAVGTCSTGTSVDQAGVDKFEDGDDCAIVLRNGDKVIFNEVEYGIAFVQRMMAFCGIKTLYGIPARVMKKYDGELPDIFEFCKEKVEEVISGMTEYEVAALKQEPTVHMDSDMLDKLAHLGTACKDFTGFMRAVGSIRRRMEITSLAELFGVPVLDKPDYQGIFHAKYPLVAHLQRGFYGSADSIVPEIEIYIKAKGV